MKIGGKMSQFPHTSEVQTVMCTSEITGELASDFMESKTKQFFDVLCHLVQSLVFIATFAAHCKNQPKVWIHNLLCIKEEKGRSEHP